MAALDDIQQVRPTSNPLSNPALSLDRLEIRHARGDLMISPEDKKAFLEAGRGARDFALKEVSLERGVRNQKSTFLLHLDCLVAPSRQYLGV